MERKRLLKTLNRWLKSIKMAEYNIRKPRMRMFAGPNGSGKSTLKSVIPNDLIGVYINPDEIEKEIAQFDFLDLQVYGVDTTEKEVQTFFNQSTLLEMAGLLDDVSINMTRIRQRVIAGGHDVPQDKVVSRYHRSLNQLHQAIKASNRAYIFDNSGAASVWVCEITEGDQIEYKQETVPDWVYRHVVKGVVQ